jgi:hypothetical protein
MHPKGFPVKGGLAWLCGKSAEDGNTGNEVHQFPHSKNDKSGIQRFHMP